ncbi:Uncharacterised protein [Mycobacterium tuberculosis]|nr:Uncharacterised protein [Mycobacterium tuberculosis]
MRKTVRPRVHLAKRPRHTLERDRRRTRTHRNLRLEQRRNRRPLHGGGVAAGPRAEDAGPLVRGEDVRAADRRVRVGEQRGQVPLEPLDEPPCGGRVVAVERVFQLALEPVLPLGEDHEQIEPGRAGGEGFGLGAEAGHLQPRLRVVLEGQADLEQRVAGEVARRVQHLDEPFERDVLVRVGGEVGLPDPSDQVPERRVPGGVGAEDEHVHEHADQVVQGLVGAARDRRADRHVGARAEPGQQGRESGLGDHERARAGLPGDLHEGRADAGAEPEPLRPAPVGRLRRARPVGGDRQFLGQAGEGVPPVGDLPRDQAPGVVLGAEQLLLPERVVGVLDRQRRPVRGGAAGPRQVGGDEVAGERRHRPAVAADVVQEQQHDVLVRADPEQVGAQRRFRGDVERVPGGRREPHRQLRLGGAGDLQLGAGGGRVQDELARRSPGVRQDRAERLVPVDQVADGGAERVRLQGAADAERHRHVVGRRRPFEAVQEPLPLLGVGRRDHGGALAGLQRGAAGAVPGQGGDARGEAGDGRRLEQGADGQLDPEGAADAGRDPHGDERVATELEEVVVDAGRLDAEEVADDAGDRGLAGVARRAVGGAGAGRLRFGQRLGVDLPVRCERQFVHDDHDGGHHRLGQALPDVGAQLLGVDGLARGGDDVGDEPAAAGRRAPPGRCGGPGAAEPRQHGPDLVRAGQRDVADRAIRVGDEGADEAVQQRGQPLGGRALEDVGPVLQPEPEPLAGDGEQGQRVVGGVDEVGAHQPDAVGGRVEQRGVERVVLEHRHGVEERPGPGRALDLAEAEVVVGEQRGLLVLEAAEALREGLGVAQPDPDRQGVDEQPDHLVGAGQLRRAAGHGRAEHDVVAAGEAREQQPPQPLHDGVGRQAVAPRLGGQRVGQLPAQVEDDGLGQHRRLVGGGRGQQRRAVDAVERRPPRVAGGVAVLGVEPGEVLLVRRGARGPPARVQGQQLAGHHRDGPAVEDDVVGGEQETVPAAAEPQQREAQRRRAAEVEGPGPLVRHDLPDLGGGGAVQVDLAPRRLGLAEHDLHGRAVAGLRERGPQARVQDGQRPPGGAQGGDVQRAVEVQDELGGVDVGAGVEQRVEEEALLERRERPDVGQPRMRRLGLGDLRPGQRDQREVGRGAPAAARRDVRGDAAQRLEPGVGELADVRGVQDPARPRPGGRQARPGGGVAGDRVDLHGVGERHRGVAAAVQGARLGGDAPVAVPGLDPAEVVDDDLRCGQRGELRAGRVVQVAEQAVADAVVRQRPEPLLDVADGLARRRAAGADLLPRRGARVEPDGEHAGEPADRAGQVQVGAVPQVLAAVAFQVHQDGGVAGADAPAAAPLGDGEGQPGEQDVVDPSVERGGYGGQQRRRGRLVQFRGEAPGRAPGVLGGVEGACAEQRVLGPQHPGPQAEFGGAVPGDGLGGQPPRPGAEGRRDGFEFSPGPRGDEVGQQDPPRHAVDDQVVQHDQQPAERVLAGVQPHELHHRPGRGVEASAGEFGLLRGGPREGRVVGSGEVDPVDAGGGADGSRRGDPRVAAVGDADPEGVVVVQHRLQRAGQVVDAERRRGAQQDALAEPAGRPAEVAQPPHDRGRGERADARAGLLGRAAAGGVRLPHDLGERLHGRVPEHLARGQHETGPAGQRHQPHRDDRVAAEVEEAVVDPDPGDAQHLGEQPGEQLLGRSARRASGRAGREVRGGQRRAVELPAGVQRERLQRDHRRRDHVRRQRLAGEVPQLVRVGLGPGRRDDVGDEPRVARLVLPVDHGGLGHRRVAGERGLDLARLDAEAADLHLVVEAAEVLDLPRAVPAGEVAGAVHALAGRPERAGDEPLGGERGPVQVAAGQARARQVQLTGHAHRDGAQRRVQHVGAGVGDRAADRGAAGEVAVVEPGRRVDGRLGRAVDVRDAGLRHERPQVLDEPGGQRLPGEDDVARVQARRPRREQRGHRRRDAADQRPGPAAALGDLQQVPDDLDVPAHGERRQPLEHRHVEVQRRGEQHAGEAVWAEVLPRPRAQVDGAGVRDDDTLRSSRRTGRVDDVGRVAGAEGPHAVGVGRRGRRVRGEVEGVQFDAGRRARQGGVRGGDDAGRGRVFQHERDAVRRVGRVDRLVGGARLQHGERRDDQVLVAREGEGDEVPGADAAADEVAGEAAGALVQLPVGEGRAGVRDGGRVRGAGRLRLEQLRDDGGLDRQRRVVPLLQHAGALGGVQQLDVAERRGRVRRAQRPHEPDVAVQVRGHLVLGVQVGVRIEVDAHPGAVEVVVDVDRQVVDRPGGEGVHPRRQAREVQPVVEGHDVDDRPVEPVRLADQFQVAQQVVAPVALVPQRPRRRARRSADQLVHRHVRADPDPQRQDRRQHRRRLQRQPRRAAGDGEPEDDVLGAGHPRHVPGGRGDREGRRRRAQPARPGRERRGLVRRDEAGQAPVVGGGLGHLRRQRHRHRAVGEPPGPVGAVPLEPLRRPVLLLRGEQRPVVAEFRRDVLASVRQRGVDLGGAAADQRAAVAVLDDVVGADEPAVQVRRQPQHGRAEQPAAVQRQRLGQVLADPRARGGVRVGLAGQVHQRDRRGGVRVEDLVDGPVAFLQPRVHREDLVRADPRDAVEQFVVERSLDLDVLRDVDRCFRRQLLRVPDALLSGRKRNGLDGHQAALSRSKGVSFAPGIGTGTVPAGRKSSERMTTELIGLSPSPFTPSRFRERDRPAFSRSQRPVFPPIQSAVAFHA